MSSVGFIGLGVMGRPMAVNLLRAGHDLVVYNRSGAAVKALVEYGARPADGPAAVAAATDTVITCLPDSPDVEAVMLGDQGVVSAARSEALLIDMSTVSPDTARRLDAAAREQSLRFLDAPVSGGEAGAVNGTLSIMVGGEAAYFNAARQLLEVLGSTVVHVGPAGSGQLVKAANQLLVAGTIELVSEAIVLLEAHGVDMEPAVQVLAGGLAGNAILERKAAGMLARDFNPGFRIDLHHKDLGITLATARDAGVALPLTATVAQLFVALRALGRGSLDHTALLTLIEDLSGRPSQPAAGDDTQGAH